MSMPHKQRGRRWCGKSLHSKAHIEVVEHRVIFLPSISTGIFIEYLA
jgi:hypothetical protein